MELNLYLIRHGETQWNKQRRLQGHLDIPLSDTGRLQAEEIRPFLNQLPIEQIHSSDLCRASETAEIACRDLSLDISLTKKLRETDMGEGQGLSVHEFESKYGAKVFSKWLELTNDDFALPGGESKRQHLSRLKGHVDNISSQKQAQHIAIFTHGGSIKRMIAHCQNTFEQNMATPNCSIHHLKIYPDHWFYIGRINADGEDQ